MQSRHLICLPATPPGDTRFGLPPARLEAFPDWTVHTPHFPRQVWYNAEIRREALRQILELPPAPCILAGFSKSALGAWNLTREHPHLFSATILFDAPAARPQLPPWKTKAFYANDAEWQADQPLFNLDLFLQSVPGTHPLVLVSGELFHDEMAALSDALHARGRQHLFLPRPHLTHRWDSGWLEEAIKAAVRCAE